MPVNEGTPNFPADAASRYGVGVYGPDGNFYAIRGDSDKNLLIALGAALPAGANIIGGAKLYDSTGAGLLADAGGNLKTLNAKGSKSVPAAVTVATTATQILGANAARKVAYLYNNGSNVVWLGKDNTIAVGNGTPLNPGDRLLDGDSSDAWWGIASGASSSVAVMEVA